MTQDPSQRYDLNLSPRLKKLFELSKTNVLLDPRHQCNEVNGTSEQIRKLLSQIYSSKVDEKIPEGIFLPLAFCKETSAKLIESSVIKGEMQELHCKYEARLKVLLTPDFFVWLRCIEHHQVFATGIGCRLALAVD